MFDFISEITFWLLLGFGIGSLVGHIIHCNGEFDRRMEILDSLIEDLQEATEREIDARNRLTDLTINVYKQLKEGMK